MGVAGTLLSRNSVVKSFSVCTSFFVYRCSANATRIAWQIMFVPRSCRTLFSKASNVISHPQFLRFFAIVCTSNTGWVDGWFGDVTAHFVTSFSWRIIEGKVTKNARRDLGQRKKSKVLRLLSGTALKSLRYIVLNGGNRASINRIEGMERNYHRQQQN